MLFEKIIKELAIKRDRSLRRIDDEKNLLKNKQIEIDNLKSEIEQMQEEKIKYENMISQYQPHLNLLTQVDSEILQISIQNLFFRLSIKQIVFIQLTK